MTGQRLPIRLRLTLMFTGSLLLITFALLLTVYLTLAHVVDDQPLNIATRSDAAQQQLEQDFAAGGPVSAQVQQELQELKQQTLANEQRMRGELRANLLHPLIIRGGAGLGVTIIIGLLSGWWWSGQAMRPVSRIAGHARRITGRGLHERIGTDGPKDELRDLSDTFDDMIARLEVAVDSQWRFVANASHELRTPLAINRTVLEVAMGRPGAAPELVQLGETLLAVNQRNERLVEGLLTLARSEHRVLAPVPVDLAEVVVRMAQQIEPEATRSGTTLTVQVASAPVAGDPALLERLVQNLLQNAVRYNIPDGWIKVATSTEHDIPRLTVSNAGPVVQQYETPGLFEAFRRLDDRVGSAHGVGLGLSIVRSVARAHGGEATATARPGGGLDVEVCFPRPGRTQGDTSVLMR
jgi:signal transduction histidine kinase